MNLTQKDSGRHQITGDGEEVGRGQSNRTRCYLGIPLDYSEQHGNEHAKQTRYKDGKNDAPTDRDRRHGIVPAISHHYCNGEPGKEPE